MTTFLAAWVLATGLAGTPDLDPPGDVGCAEGRLAAGYSWPDTDSTEPGGGIAGFGDDTDVLHYDLEIEIFPATASITGSNTMTVRAVTPGITQFRFSLRNNMTVSSVLLNAVPAVWSRIDNTSIEVTLDRAYAADEQFTLRVTYEGNPVQSGFGACVFGTHAGQPVIWTLSEPWNSYVWWPSKDDNTDKATASLFFIVPNPLVVASNGVLVGTDALDGNRTRYRWQTNYQIAPYLIAFSASNYIHFSDTFTYDGGSMPLEFYIYPEEDNAGNRAGWLATRGMLTTFSDRYGLFPFVNEKHGIYNFGFGGGMEHQTMIGQCCFGESLTAHELAHQWWGDMITCATWHDIWLNESFATYSEAIWFEFKPGSSGTPALLTAMNNRRPGAFNDSVYCYEITSINRIFSNDFTYRKGAWALHMLRHVVGDFAFFDILADYRQGFQYRSATTADFQAICESTAGRDLDWFFQEWIYQAGAPAYRYAWRQSQTGGRNYVELMIAQTQGAPTPVFSMPIDVVTNRRGVDTTRTVWNDAVREHFLLETPETIDGLTLDPQNWVLAASKSTVAFAEGPPKIVTITPGLGSAVFPGDAPAIRVAFHKNVNAALSNFSLVRAGGGSTAFAYSYDATSRTATLTPAAWLAAGEYTLTVSDVTDVASAQLLDGEIANPISSASLPSGDGLPGGAAIARFTITPYPLGDLDCDGAVNNFDVDAFVLAISDGAGYAAQFPNCDRALADTNQDGHVDNFDVDSFVDLLPH